MLFELRRCVCAVKVLHLCQETKMEWICVKAYGSIVIGVVAGRPNSSYFEAMDGLLDGTAPCSASQVRTCKNPMYWA